MTFDTYTREEIESMVSRMDMTRFIKENELPRITDVSKHISKSKGGLLEDSYGVPSRFSIKRLYQEEDGVIVEDRKGFMSKQQAENYIRRNPDKIKTEANQARINRGSGIDNFGSQGLTGIGPTYNFSDQTKTNNELIADAAAIVETAYLAQEGDFAPGFFQQATLGVYDELLDLAAQGVDLISLGIASELRNLRGDVAELYGKNLKAALTDDNVDVKKTGRKRDKFDYHPGGRNVTTRKSYTSTFHDNPRRHNFIPNRQQIQKSIHALEPMIGKKNEIATYYVTLGGRSSQSRTADALRDAFQIELGGPATDRQGGLFNRTDAYVYTPSLMMYKALHNTAMAFGLNKATSKPTMEGVVANKVTANTKSGGESSSLIFRKSQVRAKGISKPNRETREIMQQLYMFAKKNTDGNIMTDSQGRFILSKSRLVDTHKKQTLELVDDVLNDVLFGGGFITGRKATDLGLSSQKPGRVPFEKTYRGVPKSAADIQTELNFYGFEEQRRMSAAGKLAGSVNDEDIRLIGQIVDAEPDTAKYTFERIDDGFGNEKFIITSLNMDGRPVNYKTTKGLSGSKSAVQGTGSAQILGTDAGLGLANELAGISPDDLAGFTGSVSSLTTVNRTLLIQSMKAQIEGKIITILARGNVLDTTERVMLARRFVLKLEQDFVATANDLSPLELGRRNIKNLRRSNRILEGTGIRLSQADMRAFALAAEQGLASISRQVQKVSKNRSISRTESRITEIDAVDPAKIRADSSFTTGQQFAVFSQPGGIESIMLPAGPGSTVDQLQKELSQAIARGASEGELKIIEDRYRKKLSQESKEKERMMGVGLSDPDQSIVGGSKSARDIPNTGYASYGRTGSKPSGGQVGNITGQAGSGMNKRYAMVLARSVNQDIQTYNLDRSDAQLNARRSTYVAEQLKTIRDNRDYMKKLTEKLISNPNIRGAFSYVINVEQGRKGNRSVPEIRQFIIDKSMGAFRADAIAFEEQQQTDFENDDLFENDD